MLEADEIDVEQPGFEHRTLDTEASGEHRQISNHF